MKYPAESIAVDIGATKNAALYFDYVVPLAFEGPEHIINPIPPQILPPRLGEFKRWDLYDDLNRLNQGIMFRQFLGSDLAWVYEEVGSRFDKYCLHQYPLTFQATRVTASEHQCDDIGIILHDLRLIDVSRASWEQILGFRKDEDSARKLRRLRMFVYEEYADKPRRFIEDDLQERMAAYNDVVKDWGFETMIASLSAVLSAKAMVPAAGAALASAFFGAPLAAAATTGALVEIGSFALEIAKRKYGLQKLRRDHPLAYTIHARDEFDA